MSQLVAHMGVINIFAVVVILSKVPAAMKIVKS